MLWLSDETLRNNKQGFLREKWAQMNNQQSRNSLCCCYFHSPLVCLRSEGTQSQVNRWSGGADTVQTVKCGQSGRTDGVTTCEPSPLNKGGSNNFRLAARACDCRSRSLRSDLCFCAVKGFLANRRKGPRAGWRLRAEMIWFLVTSDWLWSLQMSAAPSCHRASRSLVLLLPTPWPRVRFKLGRACATSQWPAKTPRS